MAAPCTGNVREKVADAGKDFTEKENKTERLFPPNLWGAGEHKDQNMKRLKKKPLFHIQIQPGPTLKADILALIRVER